MELDFDRYNKSWNSYKTVIRKSTINKIVENVTFMTLTLTLIYILSILTYVKIIMPFTVSSSFFSLFINNSWSLFVNNFLISNGRQSIFL